MVGTAARMVGRVAIVALILTLLLLSRGMQQNPNSVDQLAGFAVHGIAVLILFLMLHYRWIRLPKPNPTNVPFLAGFYVVVGVVVTVALAALLYLDVEIPGSGEYWAIGFGLSAVAIVVGVGLFRRARWAWPAANMAAFPISFAWPVGLILAVYTWWGLSDATPAEEMMIVAKGERKDEAA
jgi:hypothetical protein